MKRKNEARVLCVDDEPNVLEGLSLHLRKRYDVATATSGADGLELLERDPSIAVIVSDMRMPGMDGATFLARARLACPEATRILLTGQADLEAAIASVNEGQIFRFLTKPCPPWVFISAIAGAVAQHNLVKSERVLLEQTLLGCIKTLIDVLSLTDPIAFGRATRIKQLVSELCTKTEIHQRWQVEVAAMLSQLGHVTLPKEVAEKLYFGQALSSEEQQLVDGLPAVVEQLLGNIPRLEVVRGILNASLRTTKKPVNPQGDPDAELVAKGAELLRAALDFDALESQGNDAGVALGTMRAQGDRYSAVVLDALAAIRGKEGPAIEIQKVLAVDLRVGMVLAQDMKLPDGTLLVARGYEVNSRFMDRIRHFPKDTLKTQVKVLVPATSPE